jgi:Flp pilus assembly protein TadB
MAQTRRKRRSKHRGTPAGTIEARGRTGRKPRPEERSAVQARRNRFDQPPTWKGATTRAAIAAAIFLAAVMVLMGGKVVQAISITCFMFLLYIPMSYYTDLWLYRRRRRQKAAGKAS